MGTESFPALVRVIQYVLVAISILSLVGVAVVGYIYFRIRSYTNEAALEDKHHLRKQMQVGLIIFLSGLMIAGLLFAAGPLTRLFFLGTSV